MNLFELKDFYISQPLDEKTLPEIPTQLFALWLQQAEEVKIFEPNGFALATCDRYGNPDVRMILLKKYDAKGFIFYTHYNSLKGKQLTDNPKAAMVFYWSELQRQVRVNGLVEKLTEAESDMYFEARPVGSRLGAWASPQSQVIESRSWLEERHFEFREKYSKGYIPRPPEWGGYILYPHTIEFWQGRPNRLHDRIQYVYAEGSWAFRRLAP